MVLVDTSVWIDYFRKIRNEPVAKLERLIEEAASFAITSVIYQEILQGADSEISFARLKRSLGTRVFLHPADSIESYAEAARIYSRCRRIGITLRSTIDCLIAQIAIERRVPLLHSDKDFDRIRQVAPELQAY